MFSPFESLGNYLITDLPDESWKVALTLEDKGNGKFAGDKLGDDTVSALYWACYFFEMDIMDEKYTFEDKEEEDDALGVLSDIEDYAEEDWSWLTK